ncbi:hypothetical protein ACGGZK_07825 [Agromyces sp. MMS24-K17]|uniref:DUF7882 family protein n=1 Tax=Agromyces sp. MMS24-K17 TaxID=3372850 RepID=UPI00375471F6
MGALHITGVGPIAIDDELLDHIFTVVIAKLRRKEPVLLSWTDDAGQEQWIFLGDHVSVRAEFDSTVRGPRDRMWLDRLMVAANSNSGLSVSAAIVDRDSRRIPTDHRTDHRVRARSTRARPGRLSA